MDTLVEYLQSEFANLTPEELHLLASGMQERTVEQYQSLCRRGEDSESFAVIKSGRVGLLDSDGRTMVTLTAGNVLGARDFFTNAPAQMTARAESPPVTFWELTAETFADLLEAQPRLGVHFAHSFGNTDSSTRLTEHLRRRLHRLPAFSGLGTDVLTMVAAALTPMELQLGDTLYRSGEQPSGLYLAVEGSLSRMTDSQPPMLIEDSALLGGENLASDIPYNHTVVAEEPTLCWELSRNDFHRINQVHPVLQRALNRPAIPARPDTIATPAPAAGDFSLASVRELASLPDHVLKAVSQVVATPLRIGRAGRLPARGTECRVLCGPLGRNRTVNPVGHRSQPGTEPGRGAGCLWPGQPPRRRHLAPSRQRPPWTRNCWSCPASTCCAWPNSSPKSTGS